MGAVGRQRRRHTRQPQGGQAADHGCGRWGHQRRRRHRRGSSSSSGTEPATTTTSTTPETGDDHSTTDTGTSETFQGSCNEDTCTLCAGSSGSPGVQQLRRYQCQHHPREPAWMTKGSTCTGHWR